MVEVHRPRFFPFVAWFVEHSPTEGSVLQSLRRGRDFEVVNPRLGLSYAKRENNGTARSENEQWPGRRRRAANHIAQSREELCHPGWPLSGVTGHRPGNRRRRVRRHGGEIRQRQDNL